MGFFSYDCKHCGHPMLSEYATDPGINEWMSEAVVVHGEDPVHHLSGTYDGYGRLSSASWDSLEGEVWVHLACWEVAGRPGESSYDGGSKGSEDQGYFFNDGDHDLIDPRIKDPEKRTELLAAGIDSRTRRRFDAKARQVADWKFDGPPDKKGKPWLSRWSTHEIKHGDNAGKFRLWDKWGVHNDVVDENPEARAQELWEQFEQTSEFDALLHRAREIRDDARKKALVDWIENKNRFEVYGAGKAGGYEVYDMAGFTVVSKHSTKEQAEQAAQKCMHDWLSAGTPTPFWGSDPF
jgi:hypothetical protein